MTDNFVATGTPRAIPSATRGRINLFKYAAWLTLEHFKPKREGANYENHKRRQTERLAEAVKFARNWK